MPQFITARPGEMMFVILILFDADTAYPRVLSRYSCHSPIHYCLYFLDYEVSRQRPYKLILLTGCRCYYFRGFRVMADTRHAMIGRAYGYDISGSLLHTASRRSMEVFCFIYLRRATLPSPWLPRRIACRTLYCFEFYFNVSAHTFNYCWF